MTLGIILLLTASSSGLTNLRVIPDARLGARPRTARAAPQTLAGRVTPPRAARSRSSSPHCSAIALARVALDPKLIAVSVGGTFAGGLHAVTGPDHLAALLPLCIGRRWWTAINTGLYWGTRRTLLHLSPRSPATKTRTPPPLPPPPPCPSCLTRASTRRPRPWHWCRAGGRDRLLHSRRAEH